MPQIEVNGEVLEQCAACGNIWDGNAQCNCWQWLDLNDAAAAAEPDSGYDTEG